MFAEKQIRGAEFLEAKAALLTGEVIRVREALGGGFLVFKSSASGQVELAFDARGTPKLGSLRSGDKVEVVCPLFEEILGHVLFECSDVRVLNDGNPNVH